MSTIKEKFAERLQEIRAEKGVSRQELCRQAGFHRTYIGKIERGERNPSLKAIEKIADELDVKIVELFDFEDDLSD